MVGASSVGARPSLRIVRGESFRSDARSLTGECEGEGECALLRRGRGNNLRMNFNEFRAQLQLLEAGEVLAILSIQQISRDSEQHVLRGHPSAPSGHRHAFDPAVETHFAPRPPASPSGARAATRLLREFALRTMGFICPGRKVGGSFHKCSYSRCRCR